MRYLRIFVYVAGRRVLGSRLTNLAIASALQVCDVRALHHVRRGAVAARHR
jgi:hypothetical protein